MLITCGPTTKRRSAIELLPRHHLAVPASHVLSFPDVLGNPGGSFASPSMLTCHRPNKLKLLTKKPPSVDLQRRKHVGHVEAERLRLVTVDVDQIDGVDAVNVENTLASQ